MGHGQPDEGKISICLAAAGDEGREQRESLSASPVETVAEGEVCALRQSALLAPLMSDDLVVVAPAADGAGRIVEIHRLSDAIYSLVGVIDHTTDVETKLARWHEAGAAWTENGGIYLISAWSSEMSKVDVLAVLNESADPPWCAVHYLATLDERASVISQVLAST